MSNESINVQQLKGGDNITYTNIEVIQLQLKALLLQMDKVMFMIPQETKTILDRIDKATNQIGDAIAPISDRLKKLVASLGSMTQAEEDEVKAQITADADKLDLAVTALQSLGADPENPSPPPVLDPPPVSGGNPSA